MKNRHNLRQRKKLRLGEFAELGVAFTAVAAAGADDNAQEVCLSALMLALDDLGLTFGGYFVDNAGQSVLTGYVLTAQPRGSVSAEQRTSLAAWLQGRSELAKVHVEELSDAWHGWNLPLYRR